MVRLPFGPRATRSSLLFGLAVFSLLEFSLASPTKRLSQQPSTPARYLPLPKLREQAVIQDGWRDERLALAPELLKRHGVDAWVMSMLEYSEDTVFFSLKDATQFSARRRTLYLFHTDTTGEIPNPRVWIDNTPTLWTELNETLAILRPRAIAVNISPTEKFADGLHAGEYEALAGALGPAWSALFVRRPLLAIEYVSTRVQSPSQLKWYRVLQELVWAMIEEAFSERTIVPGVTTTHDIVWWFRDKMEDLKVTTWFHPSVSRFNGVEESHPGQPFPSPDDDYVIREGDLLHTDMGIVALGLATDTQHLAYVLRANETEAPASLREGLAKSNRMQDLVRETMKPGKSGDQVLVETRAKMAKEGIDGLVYSHPIGDWGHSAGTLIGMTNLQKSVPNTGAFPLLKNSWYSVELSAAHFVPEWNRTQNFQQEEDVAWDEETGRWEWVRGRQERFWLVKSSGGGVERDGEGSLVIQ